MLTKAFQWVLAAFLALLSFLGSTLWYDQRNVTMALTSQTMVLSQLSQEFHDYLKLNEMRFENTEQSLERFRASQEKIIDRLNNNGKVE